MSEEPSLSSTNPCIDADQVRGILSHVIDPEVGKNIVALGLIYRIDATPDHMLIEMTMTSPACPMGEMIVDDVRAALTKALPDSMRLDVRLVWDPPWNPAMMDGATRRQFGWEPQ